MTEDAFKAAVADALGPLASSPDNPDGDEGFYVPDEREPWVVLCGEPYEFKTPAEAISKARALRDMD